MYPITFLTSYLLLVFCYFGAAEPPPAHGYGPPSPVEFNSNEVSSHEQYNAPIDFGNYGSFSSGSSSGYTAPNTNYAKSGPSFAPHFSSGSSGFPSYKSGGGKGGVSSSYISIVHGPGGATSGSKQRPVTYSGPAKSQFSAAPYKAQNFAPAAASNEGSNTFSSGEISSYFGKGFAGGNAQYNAGGYEFPTPSAGYKQQGADYEGGASDEVGSYSSGGPSYATFTGSKPSFSGPTFSGSHGGSRGGNAYSTSNIQFTGGKVSSGHGGHGNFQRPAFTANFKPSGTKTYNRYSSPSGAYQVGGSSSSFGAAPLVGSETGYNSRALKAGYTAENSNNKNQDEYSGEDGGNFFAGFGDGAGFKVQSSYSTG